MLLHVDNTKFKVKPTGAEIGGIKARFSKSASIKDITVKQLADCVTAGKTVQPGVTPFSEESRRKGYKGTNDADFTRQTVFMNDIDNKRKDVPNETPAHVAELLAAHNLKAAFMYETFNSTADNQRFRIALVSGEEFTDKAERNRVQAAIIAAFPQADIECINSDRIFFGTDKGLIGGYTDFEAVCSKADLLAFADAFKQPEQQTTAPKAEKRKFGATIPAGSRHGTLISFASTVLTKYGITEKAFELFMQRVAQCEEPKPDTEIQAIWNDACRYYEREVVTNPNYLSPAEYIAQDFEKSLEPYDYTDVGEALILARECGDCLRHSPATNYIVYSGQVWEENAARARGCLHDLTERQLAENAPAYIAASKTLERAEEAVQAAKQGGSDADKLKATRTLAVAKKNYAPVMAYQSFILKRRNSKEISGVMKEAQTPLEISVSALDANGFILNTPGGEVNLRTGEIKPHNPESYHTKITAVAPSNEGADIWQDFIKVITCNRPDLAEYLQLTTGEELIGRVFCENLIIAYGGGRNGKSTYYNTKARIIGDYAGQISAETLTTGRKNGKNWELAELRGKRLIVAPELEEGTRLDAAFVKKICSTDKILGEQKYKTPFTFEPSHTTVLYTNHLPRIGSSDAGTWRRIIVLPFDAVIEGKADIKNYADYLFRHAGGAALAWAIEGAKRFIKAGYHITPPECVKQAAESYREANDWLSNFLSECCEVDKRYKEKSGELYREYRAYCERTGEYIRSAQDFKAAVEGAGFETRRTNQGVFYYGFRLVSEFLRGA